MNTIDFERAVQLTIVDFYTGNHFYLGRLNYDQMAIDFKEQIGVSVNNLIDRFNEHRNRNESIRVYR